MEKLAVIKLSASSIKLSIYDINTNGYYNLFDEIVEPLKIGNSIESEELIKASIVNESLNILKLFRRICDINKVEKIIAISEAFIKRAKNQRSYFEEIYNNTTFNFEIYNDDDELKVTYLGLISTIDVSKAYAINITATDVQILQFNRRSILASERYNIGTLVLAKQFEDEVNPTVKIQLMYDKVKEMVEDSSILKSITLEDTVIGAGTTFLSVGKLARKITRYPLDMENCYILTKENSRAVYNVVKDLDLDKTKKLKGISEDRADELCAGMAIIQAVFDCIDKEELTISAGGFEEGIVYNTILQNYSDRSTLDMLTNSLETIRLFYDRPLSNTKQVYNLAMLLFKQLKVIHKLPRQYVKPIRIAASMYDCGKRIGFKNNENNSFEIILNSKILGASQKDILLAAFICKSQNLDNLTIADWMKYKDILTDEDLDAVRKLAVILKLASSFDKSRTNAISDITCDILGDSIIMKTIVAGDASFDIMQAQKVGSDFKKILKKTLQII